MARTRTGGRGLSTRDVIRAVPAPWTPPARTATRPMLALAVLALVAGTVITYWPVRHYAFVQLDDPLYVTENAPVLAGLTWTSVTWAFTTTHGGYWIPLTWLSYMLEVELFGASPGAMHAVNLAMHCVNAVLLLLLLSHLTGSLWRSAFVAAAFALHPLHVESVAWITERKDVLSTLFFLSAVAAYVAWVRRKHRVRHAAVLVCFGLSIMAKPMMVSFPLVLLLLDVWPLGRLRMGTKALPAQLAYLAREKTLIFAVAVAAGVLAYLTQQWSGIVVDLEALPIDVRLENALVSMMLYIGKMCWPTDLSVAYFRLPNPFWWAVGAAAALVTISRLVVRQARRRPYLLVGWLWFLVTLVPVAGFVQIGVQSMADRFSYVPLIGLFIMLAWGVPDVGRWPVARWSMTAAAAAALVACAMVTRSQLRYWKDNVALFTRATMITQHLDEFQAHVWLGTALRGHGRNDEVLAHFRAAAGLRPDSAEAHGQLGEVLRERGQTGEALQEFRQVLQLDPANAEAIHAVETLTKGR